MIKYRENGAIGALLDEYERSLKDLDQVVSGITEDELVKIVDEKTEDKNCRSIQTILAHVVRAGYNYAVAVRKFFGEDIRFFPEKLFNKPDEFKAELWAMFRYNEQLFSDYPDMQIEEYDPAKKILSRWGQLYDIEQLMEHAIVHVLRHRRQIDRFLLILRKQ